MDYFHKFNYGGGTIECVKCDTELIQSTDGFNCVQDNTELCDNGFKTEYFQNGTASSSKFCVKCDSTYTTSWGSSCQSCKPLIFTESEINITNAACESNSTANNFAQGGLIFFNVEKPEGVVNFKVNFGGESFDSWFYKEYLISVYLTCKNANKRNITSCQVLKNLCSLNLYREEFNDACNFIKNLPISQNFTFNSSIKIEQNQADSSTKYLLVEYDVRGRMISLDKLDISKLQLCNLIKPELIDDYSLFSLRRVSQKCSIPVEKLRNLFVNKTTVLYDLYLEYDKNLIPISIKIANIKGIDGIKKNRFFLIDAATSKQSYSGPPDYIRYAKSMTLKYSLLNDNGEFNVPELIIDYGFVGLNDIRSVDIEFNIEFGSNLLNQFRYIYIVIGVLGGLGFVWSILQCWNWNKRAGKFAIDLISIFKFFMFLINTVANCFFLTIIFFCIYWFIFYRSQKTAILILPLESEEKLLTIFLVIPTVLKLIHVLYLILVQTSCDIIFIDWERPRNLEKYSKNTNQEISSDEDLNKNNKVSCWRTLFVGKIRGIKVS